MSTNEKIKFIIVRSLGNFLLLLALYGVIATFGPTIFAEVKFRIVQARGVHYEVAQVSQTSKVEPGFAEILAGNKEQVLIAKDTDFSILIPKIGANSKIIPNIDPSSEKEFLSALQKGVAHAKGSVFPGMNGSVYLFAHSTDNWWNVGRYNAVFYLLKDLAQGDEIVIFFEGKRYNYVVNQKIISDPSDISLLTQAQAGEQRLVLQTCWPPGTTWKRLYILAAPK